MISTIASRRGLKMQQLLKLRKENDRLPTHRVILDGKEMFFYDEEMYEAFVENCPKFESHITKAGIILVKFWLEVGQEEQERRFAARLEDPLRQWKLSPMDIESYDRWYAYSRARDMMLEATDTKDAPWYIVRSDDKRRARLNCIAHLLKLISYEEVPHDKVKLPRRSTKGEYDDQAVLKGRTIDRVRQPCGWHIVGQPS